MDSWRRRSRSCAAVALLSVLALALGPTVSRLSLPARDALPAPAHHPHHAHHGHAAMAAMADARPGEMPAPAHQHSLDHCALCVLAAHAFTFFQEAPRLGACVEIAHPAARQVAAALPRLRLDWNPASSRGPPAIS